MITLKNINKKYNRKKALRNFNLEIKKGEIHGLIGPNGSGKTTAISVILSLLNYTGATKVDAKRENTGVSLENDFFFERLSVYNNLKFMAISKNIAISEIKRIVEILNLQSVLNVKIKKLSKGNRRKVSLASALLGNSELYIFDEPLSGLDHDNIILFRNIIKNLRSKNKTILISSHILSELEIICTDFTFISKGKIIQNLTKLELKNKYSTLEEAYGQIIPQHYNFKIKQ